MNNNLNGIESLTKRFNHVASSFCLTLLDVIIIRNMSLYKVIVLNPTGLNVISKALIFVFLPFVENLTPSEPTHIPLFCCIYYCR